MQEWDDYWAGNIKFHNVAFDHIATLYRKYIIKPYLKKYMHQYFPGKVLLLHAGCGGGQVEDGIENTNTIIGMDISKNAILRYKENHPNPNLIQGNITALGLKTESIDGIYNLGVMEHFSETEIHTILLEFKRILKLDGTVILFWPPKYGSTVIALKGIHYVYNNILHKNIRLHPLEPSLVRSQNQVKQLINDVGFKIISYDFSIKDFFTQTVIVIKKTNHPQNS
jgi:ubiquinone/menaquinone biosynthesis C-methylase UbiE